MKTHRLVLPEDLNQFGFLFGGRLLSWIDEASWIAASLDYPACQFVTIGMEAVSFRHSVREGTILAIESERVREGRTSVTYAVRVMRGREDSGEAIFSTEVSFVNVNKAGEKRPLREE
ncbi:acyl-CoA thioesterase [Roseibacillus ishigakijimensis]|uniref:Acyl-CoA thioesterase n=1 Tax=Roseibacillus ishigakijimensis TaxID=454146 RepID=A0A934VKV0_9BACT|nr:acyl-CoA thioesterase [Roseibacillus ishigakijimensis]MBK1834034.1 acyl-CoA thioesterase [Roseibacillus ishigakijimensis]